MVGSKILPEFGHHLEPLLSGRQVLIVTHPRLQRLYGAAVSASLRRQRIKHHLLAIPEGEHHKTMHNYYRILDRACSLGLDRSDTIVTLGGGVIGDMAGFAAATLYRGIRLIHMPTTIVAQQDSSLGGKVGVDVKYGKNLVGAFYQPTLVYTDVSTLQTLSEREFCNGMAEVIKHGVISDPRLFEYLINNRSRIMQREPQALLRMITAALKVKVAVVSADELDRGGRAVLNYGHTVGHALEALSKYRNLKHGEAVAIGMEMAARLAYLKGMVSWDLVRQQRSVLEMYGLPVAMPKYDFARLWKFIGRDKKVDRKQIRFVLPRRLGKVEIISGITRREVRQALELGE